MRSIALIFILLFSLNSFAHRGNFLAINNVQVVETENSWVYNFQIENINKVEVRDVKIEFVINMKSVYQRYYPRIGAKDTVFNEFFEVPKRALRPNRDFIQIEITEIFGLKDDWGGWDSPNMPKQVNSLFSEFYMEAPWRMKKTNDLGETEPIPVHFFLHDADLIVGFTLKIDYINIQVKNASSSTWGPVLAFDTMPDPDYRNLFTCQSPDDPGLNIQAFDVNSFSAASDKTMVFDTESDLFDEYVSVDATYFYFTINLPASVLAGMDDVVDIRATVSYANFTMTDEEFGVRVFRSDEELPKQTGWYRGDTHLHSMYTQNDAEIGLPLCATKEAAKLIGLDWITTTDHTSDFDNYGDGNILTNWSLIQSEAGALNTADPSMIYIAGQEVAANNHEDKLVHLLAYPHYDDPMGLPFLGDGDGDISSTSVSVNTVLSQLSAIDGFSFAAHPFATEDKLPLIPVDGGIWNLGEAGFPTNGNNFPKTGGNIIANDPAASSDVLSSDPNKLVKDGLKGAQIWNHRGNLSIGGTSGDELDAWDVNGNSTPLSQADTASYSFHFKKFRQGQEIVNHVNQLGLSLKNQDSTYLNWKMYFSGGADAHGSFNFSNTGNFAGFGSIDDNAVGKINTLVHCPTGMGTNGTEILRGMYNGNITMSDGPILTMGISDNGDDQTNEIYMGQDDIVNTLALSDYFLNFNYTTTNEFGDVTWLRLIVGTETGETSYQLSLDSLSGNQLLSYSLTDILDSVLGSGNTPQEEYFYVRAEMETFKDYSTAVSTYRTDYGLYHSMCNPIWIKLAEVESIVVTEFEIETYPNPANGPFNLLIKHPGTNDIRVNFYNAIGQLLSSDVYTVDQSMIVTIDETQLPMASGVYTIRASVGEEAVTTKFVRAKD